MSNDYQTLEKLREWCHSQWKYHGMFLDDQNSSMYLYSSGACLILEMLDKEIDKLEARSTTESI